MAGKTKQSEFQLLGVGENTYAGQNAQDPRSARRLWSWIPSDNGELHRELPEPKFLPTQLSGPVCALAEYDRNNGNGTISRFYFAAARTDFTAGTKTCNLYVSNGIAWVVVSAVGTLSDAPQCRTFQDLFHLVDGTTNWIYDGTDWVTTGFKLLPGECKSTATTIFPDGTNGPAVKLVQGLIPPVIFSGPVVASTYANSGQGGFDKFFPIGAPIDTANGTCILFNPIFYNGTFDPNVQPIQWAIVNTAGQVTGYSAPLASATNHYNMVVEGNLVIPKAGTYIVQIVHDDGMIWGIGNGITQGLAPAISGPSNDPYNHSQTAKNGYGGSGGGTLGGGSNVSTDFGHVSTFIESFAVNFPAADTYPIEVDFTNWQNEQTLTLVIGKNGSLSTQFSSLTWPYTSTPVVQSGFNSVIGRTYWVTMADETSGRGTESDSSPISISTGPTTNGLVQIYPTGGNYSSDTSSTTVVVATDATTGAPLSDGTDGQLAYIRGKSLYIDGTFVGTIASYSFSGALNYLTTITLEANALATIAGGYAVICDPRTTHWHLYASESDGSKIGQFLASVPITQNLFTTPFTDTSPFLDDPKNQFLPIFRPVRNDPPPESKLIECHKVRLWRRRESRPNFFNYTANEEVASGNNGDPAECVPGADVNTLSDLVNETSYPNQSTKIRALISHSEALYMFSERQCFPLYGQSYDDFAISQVTAFSMGIAGRFAGKSTPHGMPFISYDCKGYLYPVQSTTWNVTPQANATEALVEIGRPMRNVFRTITKSRLDEVYTEHYFFGIRDWWVVTFPIA